MRHALMTWSIVVVCLVAAGADARAQLPLAATIHLNTVPAPDAGEPEAVAIATAALRDSIVALARAQVGRRYVWGGATPVRGFDCSGLVRWILATVGVEVPRTAAEQALLGIALEPDTTQLQPGDLLVFGEPAIDHIGIYVGDGRFIHASSVAGRVIESPVHRPPAPRIKPWLGGRALDELLAELVESDGR